MRTVSVSVLKAELAEHLRHVKAGEDLLVTEHGRPVARLVPILPLAHGLAELVARGIVRAGTGEVPSGFFELPMPDDPDGRLRRAIDDERGERG